MISKMTTMKVSKETKEKFDNMGWQYHGETYNDALDKFLDFYKKMVEACSAYHEILTLDACITDIPLPSANKIEERKTALKMAIYELEHGESPYLFFADLMNPLPPKKELSEYSKELIDRYNDELKELQSIETSFAIFNRGVPPSIRGILYKQISKILSDRALHGQKWSDELKGTRSPYIAEIYNHGNSINFKNEEDLESARERIVRQFRYRFLLYATERGRLVKEENIKHSYSLDILNGDADIQPSTAYGIYNGIKIELPIIIKQFLFSTLGEGDDLADKTASELAKIENDFFSPCEDGTSFFEVPINITFWDDGKMMACKVIWSANTPRTSTLTDVNKILKIN